MKINLFAKMLTGLAIAVTLSNSVSQPTAAQNNRFFCDTYEGKPATFVRTTKGNKPLILWVSGDFEPNWGNQRRCGEVSHRFQAHFDNGTLKYIKADRVNNHPVLCIARGKEGTCPETEVLVTLKPGSDPDLVLKNLLELRTRGGEGRPLELSTGNVYSYDTEGKLYADVDRLIEAISVEEEEEVEPLWDM